MKKKVSVLFLSFLLVVSLLQCYATFDKQARSEESANILRDIKYEGSALAKLVPSYVGGSSYDTVSAIALEGQDIVYIAGSTVSTNFPAINGYQEQNAGASDCFVMKLNITSNEIIYSTFVGGGGSDQILGIAVDDAGNVYGTGTTTSYDFPTINPYQEERNSFSYNDLDAFAFKLSATGDELLYSTYLSWPYTEFGFSIDVDNSGNAYIVGIKYVAPLPTYVDEWTKIVGEGFLLKLNSTGNGLVYCTYIVGSEENWAFSVAVDDSGNAYVAGTTTCDDFPELNGYDESFNGQKDCFVVKVNASGTGVIYSTYVGGSGIDELASIAVDSSGCVYATGYTSSSDLPMVNAYDDSLGGFIDCFVFKLSQDGQSLLYSSYIGGSGSDYGIGIAVDSIGAAYITGYTYSDDYPLVNARDSTFSGETECIVSKMNITTGALEYSTYLGGSGDDSGNGLAINSNGDIIVAGDTNSEDFSGFAELYNGGTDCFVIAISEDSGSGFDMTIMLLIGAGAAVVLVIVLVVFFRKR